MLLPVFEYALEALHPLKSSIALLIPTEPVLIGVVTGLSFPVQLGKNM